MDCRTQSTELLGALYQQQLAIRPGDQYLAAHSQPQVVSTQAAVFDFYSAYLPTSGRVLDWGCCHAPDACLMRAKFGPDLRIDGCDLGDPGTYGIFHEFAGLPYHKLEQAIGLPYEDRSFDAVLGSGTLEHVAMDYESLKELHRILKVDGRLIITYLPNRLSWEEAYRRIIIKEGFHRRLYGLGEIGRLLKRAGFYPQVAGYQTHLDMLPAKSWWHRVLRAASWALPMHWFSSTLCLVASKVAWM